MSIINFKESSRRISEAYYTETVEAGLGWSYHIPQGHVIRILDLEGNQAVDTLFYNYHQPHDRYSAQDTVVKQGNIFLTTGTELISSEGNVLLEIVADTCGRHDTLGGACSAESNQVRYALDKKYMHSCRDTFLLQLSRCGLPLNKRDIPSNINFFMNVPVTSNGELTFADGVSGPGKYVELQAKMDVLIVVSNCPQLNNPCNAYNPTPVQFILWDS